MDPEPVCKRILFILDRPPVGETLLQETLDLILMMAAFDQQVSLLFLDDGVHQLKAEQSPQVLDLKDPLRMFEALPVYGVTHLLMEEESLRERGLTPKDLALPVTLVSRKGLAKLFREQDLVFTA